MSIYIYNVLSRKKELFVPIEEGKVKMYACGITVSGDAHIGHAYQSVIFDVIKKYFEYEGYEVVYVRNYTDVDDKIIGKGKKLGIDPQEYAKNQILKIDLELDKLGNDRATIQAKATENINDMIEFIENLIKKDYAYITKFGDVFFSVNKYSQYGKLSNRVIKDNISGVRKEVEPGKIDDEDFALWKSAKVDEIYWETPWGKGRPGWHIECSTMSMKYLGETIDIHGGGKDLIFPHHENEIAQSESLTGKKFSNYWIHNGLVKLNGQKMSKSLGNVISIKELLDNYNSDIIRFVLLQNNYKSDLNIVDGIFEEVEKHIYNFYKIFNEIDNLEYEKTIKEVILPYNIEDEFKESMRNDFNTAVAISNLFKYFHSMNGILNKKKDISTLKLMKEVIIRTYAVLGLLQKNPKEVVDKIRNKYLEKHKVAEDEINLLIEKRSKYKENKDYENADLIKKQLLDKGITILDRKNSTEWDVSL
ncbi:cysteine--tRNA ligase [Clostridium argentinense CDC 2741]|uniref:Cysteine--tRNA ligase n=1 Tax=Clostridium argentinense CDC 2741 TaxID=1418104 RepID=A0A0C1U4F4_9CLOT|nr:cysteine--tRNA ligase [Clostridium argentinense]ARC85011.1 cysteine--tRNA ligase [Clostridium argentinense]KIE46443.1 cysteine--tRNA ligase [Clostridium argentinense CDC 2741]NFF40461.1 cysteine--tRNA ligase [Clostridium argentinense]NFP50536.1 cysteine--tRNA ligase [Clostridium argentinense]NFP72858.1 cysteine--tRNA ligase [Clostridium argentinense]